MIDNVADFEILSADAVIVLTVFVVGFVDVIAKVAVVAPAGTVTEAGTTAVPPDFDKLTT